MNKFRNMTGSHGLTNASQAKTIARHEVLCSFEDIAKAAARVLRPGGRFYLVHRPFRLEVWLCGVNRAAGRRWAEGRKDCPRPFEWAGDRPADWLVRLPAQADLADGDAAAAAIKDAAERLRGLCD